MANTKRDKLKILVLNGPNLDLLGKRQPDIYGKETLKDIENKIKDYAKDLSEALDVSIVLDFRQSNSEADLIGWIGQTIGKFSGIMLNPAGLTHTSVGLLDAIKAVGGSHATGVPCVEVHLSNTLAREEFRQKNLTAAACVGQVMGFQSTSYILALEALVDFIMRARKASGGVPAEGQGLSV